MPNIAEASLPLRVREGEPVWASIAIDWDLPIPPPLDGLAGELVIRDSALEVAILDDWGETQLSRCTVERERRRPLQTDGLGMRVRKRLDRCFALPEGRYWVQVYFRRPEYCFRPTYLPLEVLPATDRRCLDPFGRVVPQGAPGSRCLPGPASRLVVRLGNSLAGRMREPEWYLVQRAAR